MKGMETIKMLGVCSICGAKHKYDGVKFLATEEQVNEAKVKGVATVSIICDKH